MSQIVSLKYLRDAKEAPGGHGPRALLSPIVSKKSYKRAVDRNKLKRRARAIFRNINDLKPGRYILYFKYGALELPFKDLEKEISQLFKNF